jgi:hypothetical protein
MTAPGTALAVIHNPQIQGDRELKRITVVCSCSPTAVLGVMPEQNWTGDVVCALRAAHVAAVEQHIASLADQVSLARFRARFPGKDGVTWGRNALARKVKEVRA